MRPNRWLLNIGGQLARACLLSPDAGDSYIADHAAKTSKAAAVLLTAYKTDETLRNALTRFCKARGIKPPCRQIEHGPAIIPDDGCAVVAKSAVSTAQQAGRRPCAKRRKL